MFYVTLESDFHVYDIILQMSGMSKILVYVRFAISIIGQCLIKLYALTSVRCNIIFAEYILLSKSCGFGIVVCFHCQYFLSQPYHGFLVIHEYCTLM